MVEFTLVQAIEFWFTICSGARFQNRRLDVLSSYCGIPFAHSTQRVEIAFTSLREHHSSSLLLLLR